ncbi:putative ribonuclease H-like domain-containing protein [Tanacetum coccineum]
MLVQVYVDDIIFGSTKKSLCIEFEKMMHKKFQISSMGELTFFLGLQVKHKEDGIFISQDKYVTEILKKFGFTDVKTVSTPMETHKPFLKDADGEDVDEHLSAKWKSKKKNTEVPQPNGSTNNVPDENVPTTSNDPLLSGKDRLKLTELMDLCTNLQKKVLDLEKAKTAQNSEIASLKKKVLQERKIADIDADVEVTLIDETQGRNDDNLMFDTCVLDEQKVKVEKVVSIAEGTTESATTTTVDELTLGRTLRKRKDAKTTNSS